MLRRSVNLVILSAAVDLAATLAAVAVAFWLRGSLPLGKDLLSPWDWNLLFVEAGLLYPVVFFTFYLYDPDRRFRGAEEYQSLFAACLLGDLALAGLVYFTDREISRLALIYFCGVQAALLVGWRLAAQVLSRGERRSGLSRRVLVVGGGEPVDRALRQLNQLRDQGLEVVGFVSDDEALSDAGTARLGRLADMRSVVGRQAADDVLLSLPAERFADLQRLAAELTDAPCSVWVVPDFASLLLFGSRVDDLAGLPVVSIKAPTLTGQQRILKRAFDLMLGVPLLILSAPVVAVVAMAVRLDSPGSVIFRQQRVGENGRLFQTLKFRSMVAGADERLDEAVRPDANGQPVHKWPDDKRVTRVGRFLRRWSLDELPQLVNVLKGEMSLVGPRPELPEVVERYEPWQRQRLAVPPGMTGWWQVSGRGDRPMHLNTEYDLYYVRSYSLLLDFRILLMTAGAVLGGRGAY